MSYQFIRYEYGEGVALITLARPDVLNSFHRPMALELQRALFEAGEDAAVRCLVLTGEGRAFCAGQDLKDSIDDKGRARAPLGDTVRTSYNPVIRAIRNLEKPVVCLVNGIAAGAGANLALACDFVLAGTKASFVQSFCKIGLVPDSGGSFFLPRLVGLARAAQILMLGNKVSAEQAVEYGMIYGVSAQETLMEEGMAFAKNLATQPTAGLGLIKRALNQSLSNDLEAQLALEADLQTAAGETEDFQEGVAAFLEKRTPTFHGK